MEDRANFNPEIMPEKLKFNRRQFLVPNDFDSKFAMEFYCTHFTKFLVAATGQKTLRRAAEKIYYCHTCMRVGVNPE